MDEVEAFQRATSRKRRIRLLLIAAVFAAPFAYLGWTCHAQQVKNDARNAAYRKGLELTADERTALRTAVASARETLTASRLVWKREVTPVALALAAVAAGDGGCPIQLSPPTLEAGDSYIHHGSIDVNYYGNVYFRRYRAEHAIAPDDLDATLADIAQVEGRLEAGTADRTDLQTIDRLDGHVVFVIVDHETQAFVSADSTGIASYSPASLTGMAYVFSYNERRIICAGPIDVSSPEHLAFDFSYMEGNVLDRDAKMRGAAEGILQRDLEVQAKRAVAANLRAVE